MKVFHNLFLVGSFLLLALTVNAQRATHIPNEALVQLEKGTNLDAYEKSLQSFEGVSSSFKVVRCISKQINAYLVEFDNKAVNEVRFREEIGRQPETILVQVNHLLTKRDIPNDDEFDSQWHWLNEGQTGGLVDADIDATEAWDITTGGMTTSGHEIVVAVYDDGGDLDHPDLMANTWINDDEIPDNNIDDDSNGYVDDVYGWNFGNDSNNVDNGSHGVNVAGMIGAVGDNGSQGTGGNWNVKIMNMVTSGLSEDEVIEFYSYALSERQEYNSSNGARGSFVVATNSSWGIDFGDASSAPIWCGYYDTLGEAGILNCGATSNQNIDIDAVSDLPTGCPSDFMISVTATNHEDERTFSAYGLTTVDFGAPGEDVYTTRNGGSYTTTSGTSFASPCTAGVIALMYSAPCPNIGDRVLTEPETVALEIRDHLFNGVDPVENLNGFTVTGGRINAFNSLTLIMDNCGPCPPPSSLEVDALTDVQGNLTWSNPSDGQSNSLRYRMLGATDWIPIENATQPFAFTGLQACTEYEVQIEATCTEEASGFSNSYVFITDGCCTIPDEFVLNEVENSTANASWNGILAAQMYTVTLTDITGDTGSQTFTTSDTNFTFEGLVECNEYSVSLQSNCSEENTEFSETIFFGTKGCGACVDLDYCESVGESVFYEWILDAEIAGINISDAAQPASGYEDLTGVPIDIETYGIYDLSFTPGYTGPTYDEYFYVYIDLDQNGTFQDNELLFENIEPATSTITGTMTVPGDATLGITRLRLVMRADDPSEGPCELYPYGETKDYCVNILEGTPTCDPPTTVSVDEFDETTATLSWSDTALGETYTIIITNEETGEFEEISIDDLSLELSDLSDCSNYSVAIQSLCGNDETSIQSESIDFMTLCQCDVIAEIEPQLISYTEAALAWAEVSNGLTYDLRYKELTGSNWTEVTTTDLSYTIDGLEVCTDYEVQVKASCANTEADYGSSLEFKTECFLVGIESVSSLSAFDCYPVPFENEVFVHLLLEEDVNLNLSVFNNAGKRVYFDQLQMTAGEQITQIGGLNELSSGVYYLQLSNADFSIAKKLIKQ